MGELSIAILVIILVIVPLCTFVLGGLAGLAFASKLRGSHFKERIDSEIVSDGHKAAFGAVISKEKKVLKSRTRSVGHWSGHGRPSSSFLPLKIEEDFAIKRYDPEKGDLRFDMSAFCTGKALCGVFPPDTSRAWAESAGNNDIESGTEDTIQNSTAATTSIQIKGSDKLGKMVRAASLAMDELEILAVVKQLSFCERPCSANSFKEGQHTAIFPLHYPSKSTGKRSFGIADAQLIENEVQPDEVDLVEKIGDGSSGHVYKGHWRGALVAVKYVLTNTKDNKSLADAVREILISRKLNHPNVIQTFSWTIVSPKDERTQLHLKFMDTGATSSLSDRFRFSEESKRSECWSHSAPATTNSNDFGLVGVIPALWPQENAPSHDGAWESVCTPTAQSSSPVLVDTVDLCAFGQKRIKTSRDGAISTASSSCTPTSSLKVAPRCDSLTSFNSEDGFGSPIKKRNGGIESVVSLENLRLQDGDAVLAVVMEYCDIGSLHRALRRGAFLPSIKWPFRATFRALLRTAAEISKAMEYLHANGIIHSDLKPANVLLKSHKADRRGYVAKVADFGLSRHVTDWCPTERECRGTLAYLAPEVLEGGRIGYKADVYAFGVLLCEMFNGKEPYEGLMDAQVMAGVIGNWLRPSFDDSLPERPPKAFKALAAKCWTARPEDRPEFREISKALICIEIEFRAAWRQSEELMARPASAPPQSLGEQ